VYRERERREGGERKVNLISHTHTHTHNTDTRTKKTTARFSVGRIVRVYRERERREGGDRKVNLISAIVLLADHKLNI
jgi:hypothetical protein